MPCQFCKHVLTREELKTTHKCGAIYPRSTFAITKGIVINSHIIPSDFSSVTTCFFCENFLRNAVQCQTCLISCCEACTGASQGMTQTMNCPNKNCGVANKFQAISRMANNLLEKLQIKCKECDEVVMYSNYDSHQLKHHFCEYCYKLLPTWQAIRIHYYEQCTKYVIHCDNCEFLFPREDYILHDCLNHYDIRRLELLLFVASALFQAISIGLTKSLDLSECMLFGGLRMFIIVLLPNFLFAFWAVCMFVNFRTIQLASKDLTLIHTEQRYMYLGLMATCCMFIFINNATIKYNSDSWCYGEAYLIAEENSTDNVFRSYLHYLLTLVNMICYSSAFGIASTLGNLYERKKA